MNFDDSKSGNSLKDRRLHSELKECVPITARAKKFALKKGKITVIAESKQFPLILGQAITVHKSQGSTLLYMQGDSNWSNATGSGTAIRRIINNLYLRVNFIPSHAKSLDKVLLLNFEPEDIKINESALEEMV